MQPIAVIEQRFTDELADLYDANESRHLFFMLLEDRLGWSKADYLLRKNTLTSNQDAEWLQDALHALKKARPIQYLLGHAWFMGMKLSVNDSVLIPRPETEELVHRIATNHQSHKESHLTIIDIGTGSGCIAIALKKALPSAKVYALDISADALHVSRQNAENQAVDIHFIHADILEWDAVFGPDQPFDIVVSNPPYITTSEQPQLHQNVLAHEPHLALFVEDHAPLLFYEHIAAFALAHLHPGGHLYFEINRRYGSKVCELLQKKGFPTVRSYRDLQDTDRMVHAIKRINTNSYEHYEK